MECGGKAGLSLELITRRWYYRLSAAANGCAGGAIKVSAAAGHSAVDGVNHVPGTAEGVAAVDPIAPDTAGAGDAAGGAAAGGVTTYRFIIIGKTAATDR